MALSSGEPRKIRHWTLGVVVLATLASYALSAWRWPEVEPLDVALPVLLGLAVAAALFVRLHDRVVEADRQQRALQNLRPLMGPLPLTLDRWALDPSTADLLVERVLRDRPRLVLECGSGVSTVMMAACLRERGEGRILSVDHEERFAESTRRLLRERGLEAWADVIAVPLVEREVDGRMVSWYGPELEARIDGPVDLLFVDGPPKRSARGARSPAVPALERFLAPGCWIILDDGARRSERRAARAWARRLGVRATFVPGGRGAWIMRKRAEPEPAAGHDRGEAATPRPLAVEVEER